MIKTALVARILTTDEIVVSLTKWLPFYNLYDKTQNKYHFDP